MLYTVKDCILYSVTEIEGPGMKTKKLKMKGDIHKDGNENV